MHGCECGAIGSCSWIPRCGGFTSRRAHHLTIFEGDGVAQVHGNSRSIARELPVRSLGAPSSDSTMALSLSSLRIPSVADATDAFGEAKGLLICRPDRRYITLILGHKLRRCMGLMNVSQLLC